MGTFDPCSYEIFLRLDSSQTLMWSTTTYVWRTWGNLRAIIHHHSSSSSFILIIIHPHHHSSSSCPRTHRAAMSALHSALFLALLSTWFQDLHPIASLSLTAVLRHVSLGLPRLRFLSGVQVSAIFGSASEFILSTCPIQVYLCFLSSRSICGMHVVFSSSLLMFGQ